MFIRATKIGVRFIGLLRFYPATKHLSDNGKVFFFVEEILNWVFFVTFFTVILYPLSLIVAADYFLLIFSV